jgi:hypothetical protein
MSPSTMVPSVKILALEVGFKVHNEVKMMPCFLKCFPNVETLYVFVRLANPISFIWHVASIAPRLAC